MNKLAEKRRISSFNKQTTNQIYDTFTTYQNQFYSPKQQKDVKNLINKLKLKSSSGNLSAMISQNISFKNFLTNLTNIQMKKNIKKIPSTSLYSPIDFTIRNNEQQSVLIKQQQSILHQQSQQITYRSLLQNNKHKQWIDLINQRSSNYIQQDQIALTEYKTQQDIQMTNNCDWKYPYTCFKGKKNYHKIQVLENLEFNRWLNLMSTRLILRQAQ